MSLVKSVSRGLSRKSDEIVLNPSTYRGMLGEPWYFFGNDGKDYAFRYSDRASAQKAYEQCPPLAGIINRKAQAYTNGKTFVMTKKGKEAKTEEANKLRKLFSRPNPLQSWREFEAQHYIFTQLFGFCMVLPIVPVGFEKRGPVEATSMWNIPPYMLTIEEKNTGPFYNIKKIGDLVNRLQVTYKGFSQPLDMNEVYLFKDICPNFNTLLIPESRVLSLQMPINNIIGALESLNVLINYRGALGIFSHDSGGGQYGNLPIEQKDKEQLQQDFKRYGLKGHQWKFIITAAAVKWQQVGIPTKDLMLHEGMTQDSKILCDGYNFPPHMLGLIDVNYDNQNAAEKGLYQNAIIPEADSAYDGWNNMFRVEEYGLNIIKDYSHLAVLQENALEKAQARAALDGALKIEFESGVITLNRWLELQGEDTLGPEGDIRATDVKDSSVPLAVTIGVGGVTGLIGILTAQGIGEEARAAVLEIVFGVSPEAAARMTVAPPPPPAPVITGNPINNPSNQPPV